MKIPKTRERTHIAFGKLLDIMDELREQCPWDRKQTIDSLRHLTVEETYELSDAIMAGDRTEIKKELGDILLHIIFYAKIAQEEKAFGLAEVMETLCDKLVTRHPHIYGDAKGIDTEEDVKKNWEALKLKEGKGRSVLSGLPASLPAMVKSLRLQEKTSATGFDWENRDQVWEKVAEEIGEFEQAHAGGGKLSEEAEGEFGDLLFSLVNYARLAGIDPEAALEKTNRKFISRFEYVERAARQEGKALRDMPFEEMENHWQAAKKEKQEKKTGHNPSANLL